MKGSVHAVASVFGKSNDKKEERSPAYKPQANPYTDLNQHLGNRLTDYEMVEDLFEMGMLAENEDGTPYIQLQ